jgi:hypothetical protein
MRQAACITMGTGEIFNYIISQTAKLPLHPWCRPHLPMPLNRKNFGTIWWGSSVCWTNNYRPGVQPVARENPMSFVDHRWGCYLTVKIQQRKSCSTCDSDRTPRQGMDLQQMHMVLQVPSHMPTLTHCNAYPLWLELGQIRILYINGFKESSSKSLYPPHACSCG